MKKKKINIVGIKTAEECRQLLNLTKESIKLARSVSKLSLLTCIGKTKASNTTERMMELILKKMFIGDMSRYAAILLQILFHNEYKKMNSKYDAEFKKIFDICF